MCLRHRFGTDAVDAQRVTLEDFAVRLIGSVPQLRVRHVYGEPTMLGIVEGHDCMRQMSNLNQLRAHPML